jgi:hypothetical protein
MATAKGKGVEARSFASLRMTTGGEGCGAIARAQESSDE